MLVISPSNCPDLVAGDKTLLRELLHPAREKVPLGYSLAHATVLPGRQSTPHRLRSSEVYYMLGGNGTMYINDEAQTVTSGQVVYIPPGATQYIANTGEGELTFLCIVEPAWRAEDEIIDE